MKNILLFIAAALIILSCQKQTPIENVGETDLGFRAFKYGEVVNTLYGGQTIEVGTVTVGTTGDESGDIYVRFETLDGWYIKETHVFVGTSGADIPTNKPGNPRIGQFPYGTEYDYSDHTTVVYYPTLEYDPEESFVIATHAVVYTDSGQEETAWGHHDDGLVSNTKFSGKRWGWFQGYTYQQQVIPETNLIYVTEFVDGYLLIYQVDAETGQSTLIAQESLDASIGQSIIGAAWDPDSNIFYFISEDGTQLWGIDFDVDNAAFLIGSLEDVAVTGTVVGNTYYYVDVNNNIWAVSLDSDMEIISQTIIGSLDQSLNIHDIAMSPDGQFIYVVVENNGETELLIYNSNDLINSSSANLGNNEVQIAVDEDGDLHAIEETPEEDNSIIHDLNENSGEIENSNDISVDVEDVATGPRI
ncbi:MAG: hypothetical protein C0591_13045 [Marinilabiliales bacterium]|nr:MAG: hypothetical protein C0591_13045 [Marinilabiliales bacterium]